MKKFLLILALLISAFTFAQQQPGGLGNLQGLKIAYMTRQLNLTSDEAQKFWPIYYNYTDEMNDARKSVKDDVIALDEKMLSLKKKYWAEFKKVLGTDERVNKGFLAEREFGNYIKKELEDRQRIKQQNKQR
jgi:Spy/CpxP family protein refolding chaperone